MSGSKLNWAKREKPKIVSLADYSPDFSPNVSQAKSPEFLRPEQLGREREAFARQVASVFPGTRICLEGIWRLVKPE